MGTKLEEKGRQYTTDVALGGILKIKVIIGNQCGLGLSHALQVLDDGRAYRQDESLSEKQARGRVPKDTFPHTRCKMGGGINIDKGRGVIEAYDYHESTRENRSSSIPGMCFLE